MKFPAIGDVIWAVDGSAHTVVAILSPQVLVLRYQTPAGEPNWSGVEGYAPVIYKIGKLVDVNGDIVAE